MKLKNHSLFFTFILLLSLTASAQTKIPKTFKKTFYYSFENVTSENQLDKLKADISLINGVTEVKSQYKTESGKGQVIVVVIEKEVVLEGDKEFDIRNLKDLIIKNQLSPLELIQEETVIAN